jgi:methyl-accepting chemotaxis protein
MTTAISDRETSTLQQLTDTSNSHSSTLMDLREVCNALAASQQRMSEDMYAMSTGFNQRFELIASKVEDMSSKMEDMADSLSNLQHSPSRSNAKHKSMHTPEIQLRDQPLYH